MAEKNDQYLRKKKRRFKPETGARKAIQKIIADLGPALEAQFPILPRSSETAAPDKSKSDPASVLALAPTVRETSSVGGGAAPMNDHKKEEISTEQKGEWQAFIDIPDGAVVALVNTTGKKAYYRREGGNLLGGKTRGREIRTQEVMKRIHHGWIPEVVPEEKPSTEVEAPLPVTLQRRRLGKQSKDGRVTHGEETVGATAESGVSTQPDVAVNKKVFSWEEEAAADRMPRDFSLMNEENADARSYAKRLRWQRRERKKRNKTAPAVPDASLVQQEVNALAHQVLAAEAIGTEVMTPVSEPSLSPILQERTSEESVQQAEALHESKPAEALDEKIARLRQAVEEARAKYVQADYENKKRWVGIRKVLSVFVSAENPQNEWEEAYQIALTQLHEAELERVKQSGLAHPEMKEAMVGVLRLTKIDEVLNLLTARDQYRLENTTFSNKIINIGRSLGEWYNQQPLKQKILYGSLFALGAAGAGALGGAMLGSSVVIIRKIMASTSVAVALDASLDRTTLEQFQTKANQEIATELARILGKAEGGASERATFVWTDEQLKRLEENIVGSAQQVAVSFQKLESKRYYNGWKGALAGGIIGGLSGTAVNNVMQELGGNEAVNWAQENIRGHTAEATGGPTPVVATLPAPEAASDDFSVMRPETTGALFGELDTALPVEAETVSVPEPAALPADPDFRAGVFGAPRVGEHIFDTPAEVPVAPSVPVEAAPLSVETAPVVVDAEVASDRGPVVATSIETPVASAIDVIDQFVHQDIEVQKGDSVWAISARLADQLGLDGAKKTYFIDALKDKYGDVALRAGDTITLADQGIDKEFVESALSRASGLTEIQMETIAANDAKIADFAASHPDVTLTNENVDTILHGDAEGAVSRLSETDMQEASPVQPEVSTDMESDTSTTVEHSEPEQTANTPEPERHLGKAYNFEEYKDYFKSHPEQYTEYKGFADRYFSFMGSDNPEGIPTMRIQTFDELGDRAGGPIDRFVALAKDTYGTKLGTPKGGEKVYEYVGRIAMLGIEHPKGGLRFP